MNTSQMESSKYKIRNKVLEVLALFLFVSCSSATTISESHKNKTNNAAQKLIKSTCSSTLYQNLCVSSLETAPLSSSIESPIDVITAAIGATISNVELNKIIIEKIAVRKSLKLREKAALKDCLETTDYTLHDLQQVNLDLSKYPSNNVSTEDLLILLSAARTNQKTCIDGFSHAECDQKILSRFLDRQIHVSKLCSNAMAMIKYLSGSLHEENTETFEQEQGKKMSKEWPKAKWLSVGDRKLLQKTLAYDVTVAADGSGNYKTVSEAVSAAPSRSTRRYVIKIKRGVYRENVVVPKDKTNLMLVGDGKRNTIITASKNAVDGSTTFDSATVAVSGKGFWARGITFQNAAGPEKYQAVALRVSADKAAFYKCGIIGYQDTHFVHVFRQFYVKCYISGTVDFIFGNAAVVLQDSDINPRKPLPIQKNVITAHARDDPNENTGIVIQQCRIGATSDLKVSKTTVSTYLGRPWMEYSRTIIMQSVISDVVSPSGWLEKNGSFALHSVFFREYQNTGPGADTSNRVAWKGFKVITNANHLQGFTAKNFISGRKWLADTGFPHSLEL